MPLPFDVEQGSRRYKAHVSVWIHQLSPTDTQPSAPPEAISLSVEGTDAKSSVLSIDLQIDDLEWEALEEALKKPSRARQLIASRIPKVLVQDLLDVFKMTKTSGRWASALIRVRDTAIPPFLSLSGKHTVWVNTPRAWQEKTRIMWMRDPNDGTAPMSLSLARTALDQLDDALGLVSKKDGHVWSFAIRVRTEDYKQAQAKLSLDVRETFFLQGLPTQVSEEAVGEILEKIKWRGEVVPDSRRVNRGRASFTIKAKMPPSVYNFGVKVDYEQVQVKVISKKSHARAASMPPRLNRANEATTVEAQSWQSALLGKFKKTESGETQSQARPEPNSAHSGEEPMAEQQEPHEEQALPPRWWRGSKWQMERGRWVPLDDSTTQPQRHNGGSDERDDVDMEQEREESRKRSQERRDFTRARPKRRTNEQDQQNLQAQLNQALAMMQIFRSVLDQHGINIPDHQAMDADSDQDIDDDDEDEQDDRNRDYDFDLLGDGDPQLPTLHEEMNAGAAMMHFGMDMRAKKSAIWCASKCSVGELSWAGTMSTGCRGTCLFVHRFLLQNACPDHAGSIAQSTSLGIQHSAGTTHEPGGDAAKVLNASGVSVSALEDCDFEVCDFVLSVHGHEHDDPEGHDDDDISECNVDNLSAGNFSVKGRSGHAGDYHSMAHENQLHGDHTACVWVIGTTDNDLASVEHVGTRIDHDTCCTEGIRTQRACILCSCVFLRFAPQKRGQNDEGPAVSRSHDDVTCGMCIGCVCMCSDTMEGVRVTDSCHIDSNGGGEKTASQTDTSHDLESSFDLEDALNHRVCVFDGARTLGDIVYVFSRHDFINLAQVFVACLVCRGCQTDPIEHPRGEDIHSVPPASGCRAWCLNNGHRRVTVFDVCWAASVVPFYHRSLFVLQEQGTRGMEDSDLPDFDGELEETAVKELAKEEEGVQVVSSPGPRLTIEIKVDEDPEVIKSDTEMAEGDEQPLQPTKPEAKGEPTEEDKANIAAQSHVVVVEQATAQLAACVLTNEAQEQIESENNTNGNTTDGSGVTNNPGMEAGRSPELSHTLELTMSKLVTELGPCIRDRSNIQELASSIAPTVDAVRLAV
eukprot:6476803-Amphidinium_carterae.1